MASYIFDFAISFSGDCRKHAEQLATLLEERGAVVFYDRSFLAHLLGKRLDHEFQWLFGAATRFFVPFVSADYARRPWPLYEWAVGKQEAERRQQEFVLPVRVDDSLLFGLADTVAYLDLRELTLDDVADILVRKLDGSRTTTGAGNWVATFGLNMEDLYRTELPPDAPSDTPQLYDWLVDDLIHRLSERTALQPVRATEDLRTGETFSVRVGFTWDPSHGALDFGDTAWWEILELQPYVAVYEENESP